MIPVQCPFLSLSSFSLSIYLYDLLGICTSILKDHKIHLVFFLFLFLFLFLFDCNGLKVVIELEYILNFLCIWCFCRHENELQQAANQPLPDDDDDAFE